MSEISVIDNSIMGITKIRFSEFKTKYEYDHFGDMKGMFVEKVVTKEDEVGDYAWEKVAVTTNDGDYIVIDTKDDAINLIKALNKAIELGWYKTESGQQ